MQDKAEMALLSDDWTCKEIKWNCGTHVTRTGWSHPSGVFKRPVSFDKAWDFYLKTTLYHEWPVLPGGLTNADMVTLEACSLELETLEAYGHNYPKLLASQLRAIADRIKDNIK